MSTVRRDDALTRVLQQKPKPRPRARPTAAPWSQRRVALELRYAIDLARKSGKPTDDERVRNLIEIHASAFRSRHVQYNLGAARLAWLGEKEMTS